MKILKLFIWTIFSLSLAYLAVSFFRPHDNIKTYVYYQKNPGQTTLTNKDNKTVIKTPKTPKSEIRNHKSKILLPVPFTSQAPTANWNDPLYAEACEEASLFMASEYFNGNHATTVPASQALQQIKLITEWEDSNFGYNRDIDTQEIIRVAKELFGLDAKILENFTEEDLKQALNNNQLLLIPTDGRLLGNPNFRSPGPPYHMLVIKGYDETGFITNDPGTRNGRDYKYTFDVLHDATGRWDHEMKKVDLSQKNPILIWQ